MDSSHVVYQLRRVLEDEKRSDREKILDCQIQLANHTFSLMASKTTPSPAPSSTSALNSSSSCSPLALSFPSSSLSPKRSHGAAFGAEAAAQDKVAQWDEMFQAQYEADESKPRKTAVAMLTELCQKLRCSQPEFWKERVAADAGTPTMQQNTVAIVHDNVRYTGSGRSKQLAAADCLAHQTLQQLLRKLVTPLIFKKRKVKGRQSTGKRMADQPADQTEDQTADEQQPEQEEQTGSKEDQQEQSKTESSEEQATQQAPEEQATQQAPEEQASTQDSEPPTLEQPESDTVSA